MAGIGFELRRILKKDRLTSLVQVYGYSAVLSSGPWVISIITILLVGFVNIQSVGTMRHVVQFQVVVTYAVALSSSLIITGFVQLPFTRYVADLIFADHEDKILSGYFGTIFVTWLCGIPFIIILAYFAFPNQSAIFKLNVVGIFLVLCGVWISNILAASLKFYKEVVLSYASSYALILLCSYFAEDNMELLLFIFLFGNSMLFIFLMSLIVKSYKSPQFMDFDFFTDKKFYYEIGFAGLFYNLGTWIDKFIFWYHPMTGYNVIGKVNASVVYDLPMFLAYLSIIPGMAVFFFRLEADFSDKYDKFYDSVRDGGTFSAIEHYRNQMVDTIRNAIRELFVIQGGLDVLLFLSAPYIFEKINIPKLYIGLFYVLAIGAMLQLCFMSILAILYYLDRKKEAMKLCIMFFVLNAILSYISIYLGPSMFGYGYAVSLLIMFLMSLVTMRRVMDLLDYETFMLQ